MEDNNRSDAKVGYVIANMLNNNKTLIDLNISAIRLNEQDIELIAQSLRTNRTLTHIQLGDDNFGDTHLEQLPNTSLIHISLYETRWTSAGMDCLSKFLSENCTLRELTISKCRMTDACTIMFDNILSMNRTLTHLNLSNNREMIGDQGARALADMLQVNKTLTYLNIRNNYISNDGAQAIAESLLKNWTLTELDISDNNCITEKGFEIFAITLLGNDTLLFLITGYRMPDVFKQMLQTSRDNLIVYKQ
jgi:Ran GTPase-activating protein (RanGAP) involved in mRNA processing and transport